MGVPLRQKSETVKKNNKEIRSRRRNDKTKVIGDRIKHGFTKVKDDETEAAPAPFEELKTFDEEESILPNYPLFITNDIERCFSKVRAAFFQAVTCSIKEKDERIQN